MTSLILLRTIRPLLSNHATALRHASSSPSRPSPSNNTRKYIDEEIRHLVVQSVNPETGRLDPPTALRDLLASINRETHFVELVAQQPTPIVKIIDRASVAAEKKRQYAKMKEQKVMKAAAATKKKEVESKEIQLTWGVAPGDLAHKLKKARMELEKGNRVDMVYTLKKGQRLPTRGQREDRVLETLELLSDVGKEWKPRDDNGSLVALHLHPLPKSN